MKWWETLRNCADFTDRIWLTGRYQTIGICRSGNQNHNQAGVNGDAESKSSLKIINLYVADFLKSSSFEES